MMAFLIRIFLLFGLLVSSPLNAQAWGPDGEQTPTYPTITNNSASPTANSLQTMAARIIPVIGDGSNQWGGTTASSTLQPAQVDNPTLLSSGLVNGGSTTGTDEHKFRTVCAVAGVGQFDPIRNFGVKPAGHMHTFFGAGNFSENSTYTTLRNSDGATATCPGLGLNNSLYWAPSVLVPNAAGSGNTMIKKPEHIILYYVDMQNILFASQYTNLERGETFIAGMEMDHPGGTNGVPPYVETELTTANASNVYASYSAAGHNVLWFCDQAGNVRSAKYLTDSAGVDALANCPAGTDIYAEISGPTCSDGKNLTSPGGYKQRRYGLRETNYATTDICPSNWVKKPTIITKWVFKHQGPSDYTTWTCSSDAQAAAAAGRAMGHCESFHVDWMNGWDERASDLFQTECIATKASSTYYGACNDSTLTATGGTANGPRSLSKVNVNISPGYTGSSVSHYFAVPTYTGTGHKQRLKLFTEAKGGKMAVMGAQAVSVVDHNHIDMGSIASMDHPVISKQAAANNQTLSDLIESAQTRASGPQTQQIWIALRDAAKARDANDQVKFDTNIALAKQRLSAPAKAASPMPLFAKLYRAWNAYSIARQQASIRFDRVASGAKPFVYKTPPQIVVAEATVKAMRTCRNPKCPATVTINDAIRALTLETNSIQSLLPAVPK